MYNKRVGDNMVYTYSYNEILAPGKTTDPIFTSLTAANIVEGQLDGKDLHPVPAQPEHHLGYLFCFHPMLTFPFH